MGITDSLMLSSTSFSRSYYSFIFIFAIHSQLIALRLVGLKKSFVGQVPSLGSPIFDPPILLLRLRSEV
jgi:hypothetical protein